MKAEIKTDDVDMEEEAKPKEKEKKSNILPLFWDLASLEEDKRIERVIELISTLKTVDVSTNETNNSGELTEDVDYSLKRLVKGLSSARKGARQGYATALSQLLTDFQGINIDKVYDLMEENLTIKASFKSQEERDVYFGQAFCHAAVCQAVFQRTEDKEKNQPYISKTVEGLLALMKKKSFLLELCSKLITDIIEKVDKALFESDILPLLNEDLKKGWKHCTPEDLLILLAVERVHKECLGKAFFKTHWGHSSVCDKDNFDKLAQVLMSSTATAHPRMHIIWKDVVPHAIKSTKVLTSFWSVVVEEALMQSTHERKFLAFKVLQEVLPSVEESQVGIIFSSRLMKSVFNGCTSDKNYLHTAIKQLLSSIPSQIAKNKNPGVALAVIYQLIGKLGNFQFDMITKSKAVESLVGLLDTESLRTFASWLKTLYISGKDAENDTEKENTEEKISQRRKWAITQLLAVTRNSNSKKDEGLLQEIAKFLFFHGYFHVVKKKKSHPEIFAIPDPSVEDSVVKMCKERFLGVLGELSNIHPEIEGEQEKHSSKAIIGTMKDGDFHVYHLLQFAKGLLADSKHVVLNEAWTPEVTESFDDVLKVVEDIRSKVARDAGMSQDRAFELLFLHACVQMFDKSEEATDIVEELQECYKNVNTKKKKQQQVNEEPHWSEVLTEILLSFLAQSSHLMRQVVNLVFSMILPHVTPTGFHLIIDALRPKKNPADSGLELVNESDEEMEVGEEGNNEDQDDPSDDENADEDSSDESEEESDKEDDVDEAFKTEIKSALGDAAIQDESEDESDSNEEGSDIDMDTVDPKHLDNMDKALAAVFKARSQKKTGRKKKKDDKKTVVHFRLRVLDVAETFVKKQSKNPLILELIEPLLEVIKASEVHREEQALHDRAQALFKNKICHAREVPNGLEIKEDNVHMQIERLVGLARNASSVEMVNLITQACMFLIRVLRGKEDIKEPSPLKTRSQRKRKQQKTEPETVTAEPTAAPQHGMLDITRIVRVFTDALKDFMLKRNSHLQPVLFLELIKRYPSVAWKMSTELPPFLSKAVNNFRKVQACEMILQLLSRQAADTEKDFKKLIAPLQEELISAFEAACDDKCSMKARHFHELVKLADRFIKKAMEVSSDLDVDKLADSVEAGVKGPAISRSPQLIAYCKKLLSALNRPSSNGKLAKKKPKKDLSSVVQNGKEKQAKTNDEPDDTETINASKLKKKKKPKKKDM